MRALILAAGEGVRLRPYTLDRPKCLVEVNGVTLLDRHLAVLRREGILDITLIGGYRRDKLEMKKSGNSCKRELRRNEYGLELVLCGGASVWRYGYSLRGYRVLTRNITSSFGV